MKIRSGIGLAPVVQAGQGGEQAFELVEGKHVGAVTQRLGGIGMRFDEHPVDACRNRSAGHCGDELGPSARDATGLVGLLQAVSDEE